MSARGTLTPPCVLHEDEHVLAVCKPAGWNTHAPADFSGEGIYEWLRDREPRWAGLAIVHRLDKDTSGVLLFAKTPLASRALTQQFSRNEIEKRYELLTDREGPARELLVESGIERRGASYAAVDRAAGQPLATTVFTPGGEGPHSGVQRVRASPLTGRTHQIRVHAAASGFPVLGDTLYGGSPAARLCLHAARISYRDPASGEPCSVSAPVDFEGDPAGDLRAACVHPEETSAWRMIHGAADRWPGFRVDRLGDFLLVQAETPPGERELAVLGRHAARGIYFRALSRQVRELDVSEASPLRVAGAEAPERFSVSENAVSYELGFAEGYSVGLFLDQRDNRRRLLTGHVAAGFDLPAAGQSPEVLNAFAYTCGFSVCAALAGARVTSLDLSKKYLDWGRRNFQLNGLDPAAHDFIYGDAFDWLRRLARKGRRFDVLVLDPPTFSQSKAHGRFRVEHDYERLVTVALPLLKPEGVLLACANTARLAPENFVATVTEAVQATGRPVMQAHYAPQPPDFPVSREEPAHLKSYWLRVG